MTPKITLFILLLSLFSIACSEKKSTPPTENAADTTTAAPQDTFWLGKGVNLSHWLSQSRKRGQARAEWTNETDFQWLKDLGADHVRLPIDEEQLWGTNGQKNDTAFQLLHKGIKWALERDMNVLVDLHIVRSHHFNKQEANLLFKDSAAQAHFVNLWEQLSAELQAYPQHSVAYELMNEPVAKNHEDWNKLVKKTYTRLRELEANRTILYGSNMWQNVRTFPDLWIPEKYDENLILTCHWYEPFPLTHYKTSWTYLEVYQGPVHYPGYAVDSNLVNDLDLSPADKKDLQQRSKVEYSKEWMSKELDIALSICQKNGYKLHCGEFGAVNFAPAPDRNRWYQDVKDLFAQKGISWSVWDYKGNAFGVREADGAEARQKILFSE